MQYLRDLRVRLQQRKNRVYRTDAQHYKTELQLFLQFLNKNTYLNALLCTLNATEEADFEEWKETDGKSRNITFPPSETTRAKLCFGILKECAYDPEEHAAIRWAGRFSHEHNLNEMLGDLNEAVLEPFVNFLDDRIDDTGNVLYLLQRFKLKTEWFRQQELRQTYFCNTASGERNLDRVLREALFDGGVDFPFSQPNSPSGRADVINLDDADDPLVLEVKVFDPDQGRGKNHLRQGFHQVLRYANDYQQNVGYLVVFNCSGNQLVWPSNSSDSEFPPRIVHDDKTFFLLSIDIGTNRKSASKERPSGRYTISRNELIGQDKSV
ncbi:MAG: hypothetical protein OXI96_08320 [Acidimicrobiaceae bacterium]|nr:hypothetical protein [Acidimicrobiaceae bacterium]